MDGAADVAEAALHSLQEQARCRAGAAHRPEGETHARFPAGPIRQLQLSRLHHRPGRGYKMLTWSWRPTIAADAEVENAIRDLKYGVGLNHLPSGRFAANAAWLAVQVLAHKVWPVGQRAAHRSGRATGDGPRPCGDATPTLSLPLAGRLTRSARRLTLHLPQGWPWAEQATLGSLSWPDCEPSHSQRWGDAALSATDPTPPNSRRAPPGPRAHPAASDLTDHQDPQARVPSLHRPLPRPGAATENPLPCHIGPNGAARAFSLVKTVRRLPSTPRPQAISPVAPSATPFRCPHAVHRCPSVDSGLAAARAASRTPSE